MSPRESRFLVVAALLCLGLVGGGAALAQGPEMDRPAPRPEVLGPAPDGLTVLSTRTAERVDGPDGRYWAA